MTPTSSMSFLEPYSVSHPPSDCPVAVYANSDHLPHFAADLSSASIRGNRLPGEVLDERAARRADVVDRVVDPEPVERGREVSAAHYRRPEGVRHGLEQHLRARARTPRTRTRPGGPLMKTVPAPLMSREYLSMVLRPDVEDGHLPGHLRDVQLLPRAVDPDGDVRWEARSSRGGRPAAVWP